MPDLNTEFTILEALNVALDTLVGLHPYFIPAPDMTAPFVFPLLQQDFGRDWDEGSGTMDGELMVGVPWVQGVGRVAARLIADYTSDSGAKSINQLLQGHKLGGAVKSVHVQGVSKYEIQSLPGDIHLLVRPVRIRIYPLG